MSSINDLIKNAFDSVYAGRYQERHGLVTSYDPENYLAKIVFMPEGIPSGWMPIETGHLGFASGKGMTQGPRTGSGEGGSNGGDQVVVSFNGDFNAPKISQYSHSKEDKPPKTEPGEIIMWTNPQGQGFGGGDTSSTQSTGPITKFAKDNSHTTSDGSGAVRKMDGKGNYVVQSGNQQQNTKVEHNILNQKPPEVQDSSGGGGQGAAGSTGGAPGAPGGITGGGGSGGGGASGGTGTVSGAGNAGTIAAGNGAGDVVSLLTGLLAQAQALNSANAGAPGVADLGNTIASLGQTIIDAGGGQSLASGITNLGTQMASGAVGIVGGMTSVLGSLQGMVGQLQSMIGQLGGQQGQVKHYTQLANQKGVKAAAFQENHWTTWDRQGVTHSSQTKSTTRAPNIQHQGQVQNTNNVFTTGSDFAAAHPKSSDRRLKSNIEDAPSLLDNVMALKVKTFEKRSVMFLDSGVRIEVGEPMKMIGLIAQEVREVFPEWLVHGRETDTEFLHLDESAVGISLLKAFQEFVTEVRRDLADLKAW